MEEDLGDDIGVTVFESAADDDLKVGLALLNFPITEYDDKMVTGILLTPNEARKLARLLTETAKCIENRTV